MRLPRALRPGVLALAGAAIFALAGLAVAQEEVPPPAQQWSFDGPFGTYDRAALQRGFQIYKEVCSNCHALVHIHFRDLTGIGFTEDEVKALAATYKVTDGPNDQGEMYQRPGRPSDRIPPPFANEQAARAANNGSNPPDQSLIVKARAGHADYVYAILNGYKDPPAGFKLGDGMNYNEYFPGHQIAMPQPLSDNSVTYADGTPATLPQEAHDITSFLAWASEPNLEARHRAGIKVLIFLLVLTLLFYGVKRKIWAAVH
jgi:ubiquinol-cytochrome c reductase cytochrome c1 subunit